MPTTDVLKVSGDYLINAKNGNVTIDVTTTATTGTVTIRGNLTVIGTSTNISSVNSVIADNIIVINNGEIANPGITLGTAGILIARDSNATPSVAATMLYNENTATTGYWTTPQGIKQVGIFEFASALRGSAIRTNAIRVDNNTTSTLNILGLDNPNGMINVKGQDSYWQRVLDDDDIPNKRYVDQTLIAGTTATRRIVAGGTILKVQDNSFRPTSDPAYNIDNRIVGSLGTESNVVFEITGQFARLQNIKISGSTIATNTVTSDIVINPGPNYTVEIQEAIKLAKSSTSTYAAEDNKNIVYYSTATGGGGTGLYYVNTTNSDELVSRRKAIIYGIIF